MTDETETYIKSLEAELKLARQSLLQCEKVARDIEALRAELEQAQAGCAAMLENFLTWAANLMPRKHVDAAVMFIRGEGIQRTGRPVLDENKRLERENATLYTFAEWALDEAHKHVSEVNGSPDTFAGQVLGKADAALAAKEAKP